MTLVEIATPAGAAQPPPLANGANGEALPAETREADGNGAALIVARRDGKPPIRRYSHDFVEKARRLVEETATPLSEIAATLGVGQSTLRNWILKYNWTRPAEAPPLQGPRRRYSGDDQRAQLVGRLQRAFGKQLAALEKRARDAAGETLEKDARTLGVLAKTLETLIELDRDGAKVTKPEPVDRDLEAIDADLAARIAAWADAGEER
jgi:transposase-like protein